MCGINGVFAYQSCADPPEASELAATSLAMRARGPDGEGQWWSAERRCALAHRRLAIQDLSQRAAQPMVSADGALVVTFNGMIYNYPQLRAQLAANGARFRTTSDTEVLLHLYERHGQAMCDHLRGMYAFAIWDQRRRGLFLARDPYGVKPLYTANDGWTFRFASQVKALAAGGGVSLDPEPAGIVGLHLFGSVPEPFTLHRQIRALPAGHGQWVDSAGPREPRAFASIAQVLAEGAAAPAPASELSARVRAAALESVEAHLLADVEVGLFLSAGVDSGAILGLMRDAGQSRITAITLAFDEFNRSSEDEAPLAERVARHYGARHVVRRVSEAEFRADLPAILAAMDQPSIDGINTWFVSKAAKEAGLKVALSGLGGDELLAGYPSFADIPRWVRWLRPFALVPGFGAGVRRVGVALAPGAFRRRPKALSLAEFGGAYPGAYLVRRGLYMPHELARHLPADVVRDGLARLRPLHRLAETLKPDPGSAIGRVSALESANYMKNQLLRDADWAGMAHGVEIRTPLVDYALLKALAASLPALTPGAGKRALADAPSLTLPQEVVRRAKTGFSVPGWSADARGSMLTAPKGLASRAKVLELMTLPEAA
ncbi:MAG TPA: asparagine synthase (glutamine-hydrolyzing) [Caulobacteraceae bacterium]|nr:asparagine synthase (glutamine-hydrolyzing) [Caulobacteraceae bacterium]